LLARNEYISEGRSKGGVPLDGENKLIRKIQIAGNREAADELIRKYFDDIYVYVYRQTSDKHTAMNLTQNIFVAVLQSIASYNAKKASFRTWLYRIATNKIIDFFRSQATEKKHVLSIEGMDIPDEVEFTRQIEIKALLSNVQTYVNSLEMNLQQIFRLKFYGEYTFGQIATLLGMPESTVKSKYYRLLKLLREEFKDEYY
jgi:RNA polymerase sigma factor (sigma-70 family)